MARKKLRPVLVSRVAERIKAAREEQGLSQAELGRRAETSRSHVREIESEKKVPTLTVVERFAYALGLSPEELVAADSSPKQRPDVADAIARQLRERGPAYVAVVKQVIAGLDKAVAEAQK